MFTLHFALLGRGINCKLPWRTSIYLEVYYRGEAEELEAIIRDILATDPDLFDLPLPPKVQVMNKYNEFVPDALLRKQFVLDFLDFDGLRAAVDF